MGKFIKKRLFYKLKKKVDLTLDMEGLIYYGVSLASRLNHLIHKKGSNYKTFSSYINNLHKKYKKYLAKKMKDFRKTN